MVLQSAGNDLRGTRRIPIDQDDEGILASVVAAPRHVLLLRRASPVVVDDQLISFKKVVGDVHRLIQQPARIVPHVENQALEGVFVQFLERIGKFGVGGFIETHDVDIGNPRADKEGAYHAFVRNFVAGDREFERLVGTLPCHGNADHRSFGSFQP